jgi:hypothetical protein
VHVVYRKLVKCNLKGEDSAVAYGEVVTDKIELIPSPKWLLAVRHKPVQITINVMVCFKVML